MGRLEKMSYLSAILERYKGSSRSEKKLILDEFCKVCSYNRKYATRKLNSNVTKTKKRPGPKRIYDTQEVKTVLKKIWFTADQPCSLKLKEIVPLWLPSYESTYGPLDGSTKSKLQNISRATIDRILKETRAKQKQHGRATTKPGTLLKKSIPLQTGTWDISRPGFVEADTVAHCGSSLAGKFVWSLTVTDIHTGWTENRATWNKWSGGIYREISNIEASLPFEMLGFDSDNGSEFINHSLKDYFTNRDKPIIFTRSRPYKKNDNAHVEQKNWTHVRQLFGYDRLDNKKLVKLMNDLYRNEWSMMQNFCIPCVKQVSKERIGSRIKKTYDRPMTPYHRLLASGILTAEQASKLRNTHRSINPFKLRESIERKLKVIFSHVSVTSNVRQRI